MTGATGHIGAAVAQRLTEAGHEAVGLSRSGAAALTADISSAADMARVGRERPCEAVVHAAAAIDADPHSPEVSMTNCLGTQRVVELAEHWGSARLVFLSSLPVVGVPRELPVTEDHPVAPPTAYHASKLFGERVVALAARRGTAAVSLRVTSPVGPGTPPGRIFSEFVRRALAGEPLEVAGEGTRAQDYVDVRDVAEATLLALDGPGEGVFNVARGEAVTNADLARRCVAALGSGSEVRLGGRPDPEDGVRWEVSIARAARDLGYAPARSLEDSILAAAGRASASSRSPRLPELRK